MSNPTIVLVHGAYHTTEHFGPLVKDLESHDYKCKAVQLPSSQSPDSPAATMADDISAIRTAVMDELNRNENVLVVAHSYGGIPANSALRSLDKHSRTQNGTYPSVSYVLGLAFISSLALQEGTAPQDLGVIETGDMHDRRQSDFSWIGGAGPEHYFYNDIPADEAKKWSALLRQQSRVAARGKTKHAAYVDFPCGYLYTSNDNAFPYEAQQGLVKKLIADGARIEYTEVIDAGHFPFLSMPARTSEFLRNFANRVEA